MTWIAAVGLPGSISIASSKFFIAAAVSILATAVFWRLAFCGNKEQYVEEELPDVPPTVVANLLGQAISQRLSFWRRRRALQAHSQEAPAWREAIRAVSAEVA
jgi:hypothetical protein